MSEDLPEKNGSSSGRNSPVHSSRPRPRPQYMTVGSGSTSTSAMALMASLDNDSGYGSAMPDDNASNDGKGWNPRLTQDLPTPSHIPSPGQPYASSESERRTLASHIHQLHYNQNRVALGRAIGRAIETLRNLQQKNAEWPAHYPSVPHPQEPHSSRQGPRPGLSHTVSTAGEFSNTFDQSSSRPTPRRAATSLGDDAATASSSTAEEKAQEDSQALITPQAAQDFSILKLDLKLQGLTQSEIAHSMDRRAVAALLDGRINQSVRHLLSLRDRIEDTSSKVLVTGDLNAGKSTFCNALLRRKVLPEDQQPCTGIFCEVLDARENGGIEEVHAVHRNATYNRNDESTYDVFSLMELEKIVTDNDQYNQCKVYVKDTRPIDESLLNNGVVDIALIDAPGLNSDSLKTTAVFARQEEIDVVVFVVSAANHFTLSAKEFIWNAAREKAYIFMVVNGYDNIRDKERCQKMILEQVGNLSPRTFKESSELVHFVSSNAVPIPQALPPGGPNGPDGGGAGSSGFGSPDEPPANDDEDEPIGKHGEPGSPPDKGKGKGKEKEKLEDFEHLEASLRRFVLEKRARSKLAPAKTYLMNVLSDLNYLATTNRDVAQSEVDRVTKELAELEPIFERSKKARSDVSEQVDRTIEERCADIYRHTRETLNSTISRVADEDLGVEYPGLFSAFQWAEEIKTAILDQISEAVTTCENDARQNAVSGVGVIKSLGIKHLGDDYEDLNFRSDMMFQKRRDALARHVDTPIEIWDFFDLTALWERQEKVAGTSMALTVAGVLGGRMVGGMGWVDGAMGVARVIGVRNLRNMIIPGIVATVCLSAAFMLHSIPHSLPHRLSRRIEATLSTMDYVHLNSARISREIGKVLRYPADHLRLGLQHSVEKLSARHDDTVKVKKESEVARKYFTNLVKESNESRRSVDSIDLEGAAPGVAGSYESGPML